MTSPRRSPYSTHTSKRWSGKRPKLVALDGVGPDTAATLLAAAGDNPERLKSEVSFAHLCGTAPVQASSGKVVRHGLNPGGNRAANRALHVVALNRLRRDERTRAYVAKRTFEGKSKKEAMRCLKRYIGRETYRALLLDVGARIPPGCDESRSSADVRCRMGGEVRG